MASLTGCLAMSHAPQLMLPPAQWHLLNTRDWDPLPERPELQSLAMDEKQSQWDGCMAAIGQLRDTLVELRPDTVVIVGDDQHENFLDDGMPPFAIYVGKEVEASTSLRYLDESYADNRTCYRVDTALGRYLVEQLMEEGFDPAYASQTRYKGGLGHAFARPLKFLMPDAMPSIVPVMVNTYHPPVPSPRRCVQFGQALRKLVERFPEERRVVMVASGGLSHTKIVEQLDLAFIQAMRHHDSGFMEAMAPDDLVQGTSEIRNWIVIAAAGAGRHFEMVHYKPLYRTTSGVGCGMGFARWR
jgi:aromatic ring-opening dioxygenase catalytic subunit (LigB family)